MTGPGEAAGLTNRTLGDFTVGTKLGEGGHGVVYRAEQRTLGREAAIKVLHARHGTDEALVQRFLREAQLASRLDHPFAAHIYAFGAESDGLLWIAMELVRGTTLRKVLASQPGGRLSITRMMPLLDGLCEVVHTCHEQGIVHRDLKPDNVMVLSRAGRLLPKLLDLGIAKLVTAASRPPARAAPLLAEAAGALDDTAVATSDRARGRGQPIEDAVTREGAIIGSPHYMAPEQWAEGAIDPRTDQYALGIVTFEMIAGKLPFSRRSLPDIARAHLHDELPALPADVAPTLHEVLARAVAKQSADRYPSVLAFAEAVRGALGLRIAADALPRLDDELRAEIAWLPQPIADAVAELEAARNPHQARDALWQIVRVAARWLGILALCARSRTGPPPGGDPAAVTAALRTLYRRDLTGDEWFELARALAATFATTRDAYPIPELVDFAALEPSPFAPLFALHAAEGATTSEETLRDRLRRTLPVLAPLVRAMGFLASYQLIVPRDGVAGEPAPAEVWMGTRRTARPLIAVPPGLPQGLPALADLDGAPVLALAPLVQIAAPAPNTGEELFLFGGAGRVRDHGARLVAEPHGFERNDLAVWTWFRAELLALEAPGAGATDQAPYRGLAAFTEADAGVFFGRERAATAFVNQLRDQPLLAVVGPSGTGKSSFVRAGVIPALPEGWRAVVVRPGPSPTAALAAHEGPSAPGVRDATLVIVVDQFEELFTLCRDPDERQRFAAQLARLAGSDDRVRIVLTIRDDFLARAGELALLGDRLARAVTLLATPVEADLYRVLVEPARRAGYDFEDGLAERMVTSVAGRPGALALLSFTALRLWELRDRHFRRLTLASYDAIGGVEGALAGHAEATLVTFTGEDRRLVREAFRHLVTSEGTRAVLTLAELDDVLGDSPRARAVRDRLVDARLLVITEGAEGDEREHRIEIIHEALLAAWPRLVDWQRDDREGTRLRDQLRAAARQWHDRGRPRGLLWRDEALDDYVRWRARWAGAVPELDREFGDASVRDAARGRRIRRSLAGAAAAVLVAGVIALAVLARSTQHSAEVASTALIESWIQQGQQALFAGDYLKALPFLAQAYRAGDRSNALGAMLHRAIKLADQPSVSLHGQLRDAVFRADQRHVIAIGYDGDAAVIDAVSGRVVAQLAPAPGRLGDPVGGAISADGELAALARDTSIVIWDGASSHTIATGRPLDRARVRFALDAAHRYLAVATGREVELWNVTNGALAWSQPVPALVTEVAVVGAGVTVLTEDHRAWLASAQRVIELGPARLVAAAGADRFATVEAGRVVLRDPSGAATASYDEGQVRSFAMSEDGTRLAFGLGSGAIVLVEVATGKRLGLLTGHTGAVHNLAFSPDGSRLVSLAVDRNVRVWDVAHARELVHYVGLDSSPLAVRVSADGKRIAAATAKALRLFPIEDPSAELVIDIREPVGASGFVANGTRILTTSDSGVELWDAATGRQIERIAAAVNDGVHARADLRFVAITKPDAPVVEIRELHGGALHAELRSNALVWWAVFDHRGDRIATANAAGLIELWTVEGTKLATLRGHTAWLQDVEFSPDDRWLLSSSNDRTARLWDLASGRELGSVAHTDEIDAARFDATGRRFATASADKSVRLWDAATRAPVRVFSHEAAVRSVGLDERFVAGATSSGTVQLWDLATGKEAGRFQHAGAAQSADFVPGRMLTTGIDGRIVIWDVSTSVGTPDEVVRFVCGVVGDEVAVRVTLACGHGT